MQVLQLLGYPYSQIFYMCCCNSHMGKSQQVLSLQLLNKKSRYQLCLSQISSSEHDRDYRSIMFLIGLWSIHTAFLETMNSGNTYNKLPLLRLFSNISITLKIYCLEINGHQTLKRKFNLGLNPGY